MPAVFIRHFVGLRRVFPFGGGKVRLLTHRRSLHYLGLLLVMHPLSVLLPHSGLSGGLELGAVAETLAANLAMLAGLAALLHYGGTQRPLYAFVGSGLLGAAVLDGLHAFAAWELLAGAQPVGDAAASGSRWFLPLWLWAGVWASSSEQPMARLVREARAAIWLAAAGLVLLCLLGARVVPTAGAAAVLLGHAASAALFFGAVEAMLRRRHWPHDIFEHCLMLALILGFVANTLFLGGARGIYDPLFVAALHLKNLSYLFVLAGLAIGMRQLLRQAEGQALALAHANESLQREIGEHSRVRQQYQDLSHSLEQRVEARTRELAQAELTAQDAKKKAEQAQQLERQTNRQLRAQMEERMAVEKELRESENRLQLALAAGQVGMWTLDIQTGSKTWDDRVYLFMGETPGKYSPAELGRLSRVHPEDAQELEQAVRRTLEQGMDLDVAGRVVWRDGSVRHVVSRGAALRDAQGNITGIVGTLTDVTEHTLKEQELLRQGEQLEERVRALRCVYEVAHAVADSDLALESIYQRVIELLPLSCRDPGATLARLVVADQKYDSAAWNGVEVQHRAEIVAGGSPAGRIEIGFANGAGRPESRAQIIQVVDMAVASLGRAMELRRADDRLRRSEQRYRGLFDHMISHWALNEVLVDETGKPVDARFLEVNPAFEQFVGLRSPEILTKTLREIFWDLDRHMFAKYAEVALSGEPAWFEGYSRAFDRHLEVAVFSPERGRFAVVFNDISKRKRAEETLSESRRRMHTLLGNLPGMAYRCTNDPDRTMEFVSKGCEALTGLKPAELVARGFAQLIDPEDRDAVWAKVQQAIEEHRPFQLEYRIRTADGRSKWLWEQGAVIFAENGEVEALEGFINDITERKHAEQALDRKAGELAASNAELEHFAHAASHDLQEPLRMIAGYTQLLARRYRGKLDKDADQFLQYTIEGTERMQALVRDLLSYSRVGRGAVDHEPVNLEECARASLANLQAAIGENGAQVELEPLPVVRGLRSQLIQLFQNLIGNAVKYRRDDPPLVRVSAERRGDEWLFAVRDNGIGIDPEYRDQVFELFRRLHGRSQYSGTGIGLAICKKIVESHGGRIWVGSEAGPGTTFEFTLPAEPST